MQPKPPGRAVLAVAAGLLAALVAATYLVQSADGIAGRTPAPAGAAHSAGLPGGGLQPPGGGAAPTTLAETERLIRVYEQRSRTIRDAGELTFLAQLYLQRGRITGDVATYQQAHEALRRALAMAPRDQGARTLFATTQATMHDFAGALANGQSVLRARPDDPSALAVVGDAELETGRYDDAAATFTRLARLAPGAAAVLVRQARLAWLRGDVGAARDLSARAAKAAVEAGAFGAGLAFYPAFQGQLELEQGDYPRAGQRYQQALDDAPGWHVALAGLGRVKAAQGDLAGAAALLRQAIDVVPQPEYLAALGDVLAASGDPRGAQQQYAVVALTGTLAGINRQLYNRQLVLFDADHDRDVAEAVRLARAELAVRGDVYGWDALAWALLAAGQPDQARPASEHALALGGQDPRLLYHAGMIAAAQGEQARARELLRRTLAISPRFDPLQAERARATLASLAGAR